MQRRKINVKPMIDTQNSDTSSSKKVIRFHQFIHVEKGKVNSAVIDLLKGNVYHVENHIIKKLEEHRYDEITQFLNDARDENLLIEVNENTWIPRDDFGIEPLLDLSGNEEPLYLELHVDEKINLSLLLEKFKKRNIAKIIYYSTQIPPEITQPERIVLKEKNHSTCYTITTVVGNFSRIDQSFYSFNLKHNSCWGQKIAFSSEGKIKPCIYSHISIMDFNPDVLDFDIDTVISLLQKYWDISKNKVEKCKDCEFRYICFDCREIPFEQYRNIFAPNPLCKYDPDKGSWE